MGKIEYPKCPDSDIKYGILQNEKDFEKWVAEMIEVAIQHPMAVEDISKEIFFQINQVGYSEGSSEVFAMCLED